MKKILGCLLFSLFAFAASSQIIYFETGKTLSSFDYKNSAGTPLKNLKGSNQNSLGIGVKESLFHSPWHISFDAAYNRYGSMGSDPILGNYYEWDVTYLGANLGFEYEFFKPETNYNEQHGFSFYLKTSVAAEFLLDGTQNLNNQISNLKGVEEFDKPFYFLRGGVGLNYYISKTFVVFAQYMGGKSFLVGSSANQEQLHLITHNISIGFSINLMYK